MTKVGSTILGQVVTVEDPNWMMVKVSGGNPSKVRSYTADNIQLLIPTTPMDETASETFAGLVP